MKNFICIVSLTILVFASVVFTSTSAFAADIDLAWSHNGKNANGSNMTDFAGYKVYRGLTPGASDEVITLGGDLTLPKVYQFQNVPDGDHYFRVTAYDIWGNESGPSNEIMKTAATPDTDAPSDPFSLIGTCANNITCTNCFNGCVNAP